MKIYSSAPFSASSLLPAFFSRTKGQDEDGVLIIGAAILTSPLWAPVVALCVFMTWQRRKAFAQHAREIREGNSCTC